MRRFLPVAFLLIAFPLFLAFTNVKPAAIKPENGMVKVALKDLNDGKPHFYKVSVEGKEVRFFMVISSDGVPRAAFDACDVCYPAKKGYGYEGEFMICNNCGRRFHTSKINVVQGGCNPSPLERSYDDSAVTISLKSLSKGTIYF